MSTAERALVVIPAYNEAATVASVVQGVIVAGHEVVVVDDGSSDATAEVARASGATVVSLPENRGKGAALRLAFERLFGAGFEAIVTLDADGQHVPEEIPRLLEHRDVADLVVCSRVHLFAEMGRVRRTSNRLSSSVISLLAGVRHGPGMHTPAGDAGGHTSTFSVIADDTLSCGYLAGYTPPEAGYL